MKVTSYVTRFDTNKFETYTVQTEAVGPLTAARESFRLLDLHPADSACAIVVLDAKKYIYLFVADAIEDLTPYRSDYRLRA